MALAPKGMALGVVNHVCLRRKGSVEFDIRLAVERLLPPAAEMGAFWLVPMPGRPGFLSQQSAGFDPDAGLWTPIL